MGKILLGFDVKSKRLDKVGQADRNQIVTKKYFVFDFIYQITCPGMLLLLCGPAS
jgi:hypothetical protein